MLVWSGIQGFGIWNLAPGIRNPLNKWNQETSTQNVVKNCKFLLFFSHAAKQVYKKCIEETFIKNKTFKTLKLSIFQ